MAAEVAVASGGRAPRAAQFRNVCFTINNPHLRGVPTPMFDALPARCKYIVWQLEQGEHATRHIQGYVEFTQSRTLRQIQLLFSWGGDPSAIHIEQRHGTAAQAAAYCKKEDTRIEGPWEYGEISQQGHRPDTAERRQQALTAVSQIRAGTTCLRDVAPDVLLDHPASLKLAQSMATAPMRPNVTVYYVEGETGVGKSFNVFRCFPDAFRPTVSGEKVWFDGYGDQTTLFLDELRGGIKLSFLLQILDPYPMHVEFKGGMVPARWERVIIGTNTPPSMWYPNIAERDPRTFAALMRRIHHNQTMFGGYEPDGEGAAIVADRDACQALFDRWFPL